jgi:16S rRNA (cytosine1402-N4)-methyltransferase
VTPHNAGRPKVHHTPVLIAEVLDALGLVEAGAYIDCTVGEGGHTEAILNAVPGCRVLGLDRDPSALATARDRLASFGSQARLANASYASIVEQAKEHGFFPADGVLMDLGISSLQLAEEGRGFSFQRDDPLDMRFGPEGETLAEDVVNHYSERALVRILQEYGEEPRSRRIANAIVRKRPLRTTGELAKVVEEALGGRGRIHPATRTFQAIRIEVNQEMRTLQTGLAAAIEVLRPGGKLVVISYHSLEDREVKVAMRESPVLKVITKKPIPPSLEEVRVNPRSRSARMRVSERLDGGL